MVVKRFIAKSLDFLNMEITYTIHVIFAWYVSLCIVFAFANYWEYSQKKHFGAKYSLSDILLTTLGGVLVILLVQILK